MVLKDIDYLYFYCVIDNFLFGELDNIKDGKIWEFNNFYSVWERICLIDLFKYIDLCFVFYLNSKYIVL